MFSLTRSYMSDATNTTERLDAFIKLSDAVVRNSFTKRRCEKLLMYIKNKSTYCEFQTKFNSISIKRAQSKKNRVRFTCVDLGMMKLCMKRLTLRGYRPIQKHALLKRAHSCSSLRRIKFGLFLNFSITEVFMMLKLRPLTSYFWQHGLTF